MIWYIVKDISIGHFIIIINLTHLESFCQFKGWKQRVLCSSVKASGAVRAPDTRQCEGSSSFCYVVSPPTTSLFSTGKTFLAYKVTGFSVAFSYRPSFGWHSLHFLFLCPCPLKPSHPQDCHLYLQSTCVLVPSPCLPLKPFPPLSRAPF